MNPKMLTHEILTKKTQIRRFLWGAIVVGTFVNILSGIGEGISLSKVLPLVVVVGISLICELLIWVSQPKSQVRFSASQLELRALIPQTSSLLEDATEFLLLGGTLKTITDDSRTISAIDRLLRDGKQVRVLAMHPSGGGVESTARARQSAGKSITEDDLRNEIRISLKRLVDGCGPAIMNCIRLYKEHPTYSMHSFGSKWVLTVYTLGRGASSPAIYFEDNLETHAFAEGLRKGFEELWRAPTTEPLDWSKMTAQNSSS